MIDFVRCGHFRRTLAAVVSPLAIGTAGNIVGCGGGGGSGSCDL